MLLDSLHPIVVFQRKLYFEYLKKVSKITGKSRSSLTEYEKEFCTTLSEDHYPSSKKEFLDAIHKSEIILFGDFHTLMTSQTLMLESIKSYKEHDKEASIVIALEAFDAKDKEKIRLYSEGKISEEEFLKKTRYYKKWCFPWFHYKKIFNIAKELGISVVPVNSSLKSTGDRDKAIAKNILLELEKNGKKTKIFCLIGEFHLAENHLSLKLYQQQEEKKSIHVTRVLSNVDEYFFNHKFRKVPGAEKYLSLDVDYYCLINTPPWIKWLTYLQWEDDIEAGAFNLRENKSLSSFDYVLFKENFDDVEFLVGELIRKLASFFKVSVYLKGFYYYSLKVIENDEKKSDEISCSIENEFLRSSISVTGYSVCCDKKIIFYSVLTLGSLLSSIGAILFSIKTNAKPPEEPIEIFSRSLLKGMFSALCELIFNPYAHTNQASNSSSDIFLDMKKVNDFLTTSQLNMKEEEVLSFMQHLSGKEDFYWGYFFRFCARRMFERLFHNSSFFLAYIQKDVLKRKPQKSFKETLERYLEVALAS